MELVLQVANEFGVWITCSFIVILTLIQAMLYYKQLL